jgi:vacuolar-type H+-ATPase subunit B/Vma2
MPHKLKLGKPGRYNLFRFNDWYRFSAMKPATHRIVGIDEFSTNAIGLKLRITSETGSATHGLMRAQICHRGVVDLVTCEESFTLRKPVTDA